MSFSLLLLFLSSSFFFPSPILCSLVYRLLQNQLYNPTDKQPLGHGISARRIFSILRESAAQTRLCMMELLLLQILLKWLRKQRWLCLDVLYSFFTLSLLALLLPDVLYCAVMDVSEYIHSAATMQTTTDVKVEHGKLLHTLLIRESSNEKVCVELLQWQLHTKWCQGTKKENTCTFP